MHLTSLALLHLAFSIQSATAVLLISGDSPISNQSTSSGSDGVSLSSPPSSAAAKKGKNDSLTDQQRIKLKELRKLARYAGHEHPEVITEIDGMTCYSEECLEAAKEFYSAMDFSQEPCRKWKKFACEWRTLTSSSSHDQLTAQTFLVQDQLKEILKDQGIENGIIKTAQVHYRECVSWFTQDLGKKHHVLNYIEKVGDWPLLTGRTDVEKNEWIKVLAEIIRTGPQDVTPLLLKFDSVVINEKIALKLESGTTSLVTDPDDIQLLLRYLRKTPDQITPIQSKLEAQMIDEMQAVSKRLSSSSFNLKVADKPKLMTLQTLKDQLKETDPELATTIADLLNSIFKSTDVSSISPEMEVITDPQSLAVYLKEIANADQRAVLNLSFLQLTLILLGDMTNILDELNIVGVQNYIRKMPRNSEENCLQETTEMFGYALSEEYMSRHFTDDKHIAEGRKMVDYLKHGFLETVKTIKWMGEGSKELAVSKVKKLEAFVGYPDWIQNSSWVEQYYYKLSVGIPLNGSQLYPNHRSSLLAWLNGKLWQMKLGDEPPTPWNYDMSSSFVGDVDVKYLPFLNQLRIPAGALQPPLFSANYPGFMNFGGLGLIIATEMARVLDSTGIYLNNDVDDPKLWLDTTTFKSYRDWLERLQGDWDGDNELTQDQKIASLLAYHIVTHAYEEYLKDLKRDGKEEMELPGLSVLSPEKLLHIRMTNTFCESPDVKRLRQLGEAKDGTSMMTYGSFPLTRTKYFVKIFGCRKDNLGLSFDFV